MAHPWFVGNENRILASLDSNINENNFYAICPANILCK